MAVESNWCRQVKLYNGKLLNGWVGGRDEWWGLILVACAESMVVVTTLMRIVYTIHTSCAQRMLGSLSR